ncbi:MAG TPA: magnesium/cobalt transporter CorA [Desulfuromonadales bacterium]|nr:magnesium/cobalt transporter CorA [Desulfuromonadales bacterium]
MRKRLVKKSLKKVGASPGTLMHIGEKRMEQVGIQAIGYDAEQLQELPIRPEDAARSCLVRGKPTVTWINIDGLHQVDVIETMGKCFDLHPLMMEDILETGHRPKFEDYETCLFLVLKRLHFDEAKTEIRTEQVSLVLGTDFVLSFQEGSSDIFDGVRDRIRNNRGKIRRMGADYLAYALLDSVVDSYFVVLEKLGDRIELLEEELIAAPSPAAVKQIHHLKREMILLRKAVWPLREGIGALQRVESPLMQETTGVFLRDVYDHTIQVIDTVETFRDLLAGMLDIYLSSVSNRMNEIMKVLTIIATIFIPLTFLAGVWGMNFDHMPELRWRWGYALAWGLMLGLAGGMLVVFRRKKWL